ncbi:hypothetical protein CK503_13690 [Aliifodinibius salipaludis]|uniref:ABC transporter domain-containing protein n=1 Tax=Fodinibius salipaludis TaxID=2032627 RepID=A0A2A2G7J3_9BACT|nr:ABC transporter ATP-binding protein [Aliifodinibius salipaludis]PAU92974.1 hypothetical protein CK503_13690 [Aliifodinibius salipaludis]
MTIYFNNVTKTYKDFSLSIPELHIKTGEVVKLFGKNGAGKTTLLRLIVDLVEVENGIVTIDGMETSKTAAWKKSTACFLDDSFLIKYLEVQEYYKLLYNFYSIPSKSASEVNELAGNFLDMYSLKDKRIENLSTGNQVKVGVLGTLLVEPKLLILDEPIANLDPESRIILISLLKRYKANNDCTIILSSHDLNVTNRITGRSIILDNGAIKYDQYDQKNNLEKIQQHFNNSL